MFDPEAVFASVRAKREIAGMNVHFLREDGTKDCFSFADVAKRDRFIETLKAQGRIIC